MAAFVTAIQRLSATGHVLGAEMQSFSSKILVGKDVFQIMQILKCR